MKLSAAEVTIIRTIRGAAGGIPQAGAFLILANRAVWTGGVFSQVGAGLTIVVHGGCSRQTSRGSGFSAHGAAVHKPVTGIGFYLVMFLTVTAGTAFSVLNITLGNTRIVIALTSVATNAVSRQARSVSFSQEAYFPSQASPTP